MSKDNLGKRMKEQYENRTKTYLPRRTYSIIRLDGKAFHTYTKSFNRPYDLELMDFMTNTAKKLCEEIQGVQFAYVQSDEISLLLTDFNKETTDAWFNGEVQKIVSVSASLATGFFNNFVVENILRKNKYIVKAKDINDFKIANFDSRVFIIPDPIEVENYFIWRQKDAIRNSISMHAQSIYSHNELNGKSQADMKQMIKSSNDNWDILPEGFKLGRTILKEGYKDEPVSLCGRVIDSKFRNKWESVAMDFINERDNLIKLIPHINI